MARKQITQFTSASAVALTDYLLLQPGPTGTDYVYAPVSMIMQGTLAATVSTITTTGTATVGTGLNVGGIITPSFAGTVSTAGSDQATATLLSAQTSVITTATAGQGVRLADENARIINRGTVAANIYPPSGAQIETYGTNTAITLQPNASIETVRSSATLHRIVSMAQLAYATATATLSTVASAATSAQALAANASRIGVVAYNSDANAVLLKYGTTASGSSFTYRIPAGGHWEMPSPTYTGRIDVIWEANGDGSLFITEMA